jgi:TonB-linked SusC/RagA family outer membrane protein
MEKFREPMASITFSSRESFAFKKIIRMVRFTLFCFFLSLLQVLAVESYSQQTRLTLNQQNQKLEDVLKVIEDRSEFFFLYNRDLINVDQKVNINENDQTITVILNELLKGTDIKYSVINRQIILSNLEGISGLNAQQQKSVSGKVTDSSGGSMPGVSVVLKGTTTGIITGANGNYSLTNVPTNATLQFSFVGMKTQEILVGNKTTVNIVLEEETIGIDEVVAIGYGTQKKSDLTGAVSVVKTNDLSKSSSSSIIQTLAGKAAGLTVTQISSQPGGGLDLQIRGAANSSTGHDPLYIIDGFPISSGSVEPSSGNRYEMGSRNPLNSINPNDIESVEILKDASSTAIYGARASNGVIIITTKKGKAGKTQVNYSTSFSIQTMANRLTMLKANELMTEVNRTGYERWMINNKIAPYGNADMNSAPAFTPKYTQDQINVAGDGTDWYSEVTRNGQIQQHNLSFTGGSDKTNFMVSFNYFGQDGIVKNSGLERYSGRINLESEISKMFKFGTNLTVSLVNNSNVPLGDRQFENSGVVNAAIEYDPRLPVKDAQGNYSLQVGAEPNPVSLLEITDITAQKRILATTWIQANVTKGLNIKLNIGIDNQIGKRSNYLPKTTLYGLQAQGSATISENAKFDKLGEVTANYTKSLFGGKHNLTALVGYSFQEFNWDGFSAGSSIFLSDNFLYNNLQSGEVQRPSVSSYKGKELMASYFGRINYNMYEKYLLTLSIRRDGSDKFGANNKFGTFPSAAVAWRINNENFMKSISAISNLKLRLSYGQTGNSNIGSNANEFYTAAYNSYVFENKLTTGVAKQQLANPDLKWETATEINLGLDCGFFGERITSTFEYFDRTISDLLGYRQLPSYYEIRQVAANLGKTSSKGFEATIVTRNVKGKFDWTTTINFSKYIDRWKERSPDVVLAPYQKADDKIRAMYDYTSDGILQAGEAPPAYMPGLLPGQMKVKDINGFDANNKLTGTPDGKLNEADISNIGCSDPGYTIGIGNTMEYKNFDLNIFFYGMFNRLAWNDLRGTYGPGALQGILDGFNGNSLTEVKNRWTHDNQNTNLPSGVPNPYPGTGTWLLENGAFLRCKNITLGYTIPQKSIFKNLSKARIYIDLNNPFVLTHYTGIDPEMTGRSIYPPQRSFAMGVDVTF